MGSRPPTITDANVTLPASWGAAGQYYGYCTVADVRAELSTFNLQSWADLGATSPGPGNSSFGNGDSIIAWQITLAASLDVDAMLARYYQMPYVGSDTTVLDLLRIINTKLAAARLAELYQLGNTGEETPLAQALKTEGETYIIDIQEGHIPWGPPFNDAQPMGDKPIYPLSALAQVQPNPGNADDSAVPIFTIGSAIRFRRDTLM